MRKQKLKLLGVLVFGVFLMGCGQGKVPKSKETEVLPIFNNSEKIVKPDSAKSTSSATISRGLTNKAKLVRRKVIQSDSTYAIQFYDENGVLTGIYDIWENNPFELADFEKYNDTPGNYPMRYKVPGLTKTQLSGKVPDELMNSIKEGVHIGRIDVFPKFPSKSHNMEVSIPLDNYIPILYQLNAMEGYEEEYEIPASFGIINILKSKGNIWKSIRITNSGWGYPAVTQDGKYLVYTRIIPNKETGGCFDIYDLESNDVVFTKCVEGGVRLNIFSRNKVIGAASANRLKKSSERFYVNSETETLYRITLENIREFGVIGLENGIVLKHRKTKESDTLFFSKDFTTINLKK